MKLVKVKYLPCSARRGSRLKAWCAEETVKIIEAVNQDIKIEEQARDLAQRYIKKMKWSLEKMTGFGYLANGEWGATVDDL